MSPFARIASIPVASVATIGLVAAIVVAPPAAAEPCTGAAAEAQPPAAPNAAATPEMPGVSGPPIGHRPSKANDSAPLPNLGRLSRSLLNAFVPQSARVQQQAGVAPPPVPPAVPDAAPIAQPAPPAPAPGPAPAPAPGPPPGTSLVGWVTGPQSPNDTIKRFAITGTDLGIMWDNGDPGEQPGADGLRRHHRLLQRPRQAVAVQHDVPHQRPRPVQDGQRSRTAS